MEHLLSFAGVAEAVFFGLVVVAIEEAASDGGGEGVGGVVRLRLFLEAEVDADHLLDLRFGGGAVAGEGFFDFVRGVFADFSAVLLSDEEDDAAGFSDGDASSDVFGEKELFDGDDVGAGVVKYDLEGFVKLF